MWPHRASRAALALIKEAHDVEPSLGIRLLTDLKTVFGGKQEMTTAAILGALHILPESPWGDLKGKPLNDRGLAVRLRQYGIKPKVIRVGDATPRGYTAEDLYDPWETYLPRSQDEESATSATSATNGGNASDFNAENVAGADEASATSPDASATDADNVADRTDNLADSVADKPPENASNNNSVSDVALVALPPETDRDDDLRYLTISSGKSDLQAINDALWRRGDSTRGATAESSSL